MEQLFSHHNPERNQHPLSITFSPVSENGPKIHLVTKTKHLGVILIPTFAFSQTQIHWLVLLILYLKYTIYFSTVFFPFYISLSFKILLFLAWTMAGASHRISTPVLVSLTKNRVPTQYPD